MPTSGEELIDRLDQGSRRLDVAPAGRGIATQAAQEYVGRAGDVLLVEPNQVHQFVNTSDEPLQFLCLVPVEFDCGGGDMAPTPGS